MVYPSASSPPKLWYLYLVSYNHSWFHQTNLFSGSILEIDKFSLQGKSKAWPRGWFARDREPQCEPCQAWLLVPRAPSPVAARCVSSDACTSCPTELSCLHLQVARIALLWAVLFLALRTEEPHTHIKQTKNMSGPKKHSVSQRQRGVAPAYQGIPCHGIWRCYRHSLYRGQRERS